MFFKQDFDFMGVALCLGVWALVFFLLFSLAGVKLYPQEATYLVTESELSELENLAQELNSQLQLSRNELQRQTNFLKASNNALLIWQQDYNELKILSAQSRQEDQQKIEELEMERQELQNKVNQLIKANSKKVIALAFTVSIIVCSAVVLIFFVIKK